jgi:hypothetical protein
MEQVLIPPTVYALGEMTDELREYKAIVWTSDEKKPGERVTLWARSLDDARAQIDAKYGPNIVCSLWNEEDANKLRE